MAPLVPKEKESQTNSENPKDHGDQNEKALAESLVKQGKKANKLKEHVLKIQSQGKESVKEKNEDISNRLEEFFEWKPPPPPETMGQKFSRKAKENPFVPIGSVCTLAALSYGLISFVRGDKRMQQYMMRARVLAQGGTIVAITVGLGFMLYHEGNKKTNKKLQ